MTVAPAVVLSGALLTGGRHGKALVACPLLGAAAGGFSLANGGLWCLVHKHRRPDDSDGGRGSGGNERGAGHREAEGQGKRRRSFALAAGRAEEDWEGSGSGTRLNGHGDPR